MRRRFAGFNELTNEQSSNIVFVGAFAPKGEQLSAVTPTTTLWLNPKEEKLLKKLIKSYIKYQTNLARIHKNGKDPKDLKVLEHLETFKSIYEKLGGR